ncbi:MAG: hypothetical protein WBD07_10485 [Vicinamibacterales bacterium]
MNGCHKKSELAIVAAGMVAYASIVLSHLDYVPLWDGRFYADCILAAAERLSFGALGCAGHPSHAYVFLVAMAVRLAPGSLEGAAIVVANVLMGLIAIAALGRLLGHVLPGRQWATERALACCAFAVHPLFTTSTLQPNVDFGTLVFALPCLCALLERRVLTAAVLGCLVIFTKETGVVVYTTLTLSVLFFVLARPAATWRETLARLKPFVPLAMPTVLGLAILVDHNFDLGMVALLSSWSPIRAEAGVMGAQLVDAVDVSYFTGLLILNFMWVPTIVIATDLALGTVARLRGRADPALLSSSGPNRAIVYGTLLAMLILTRHKTFSNFRYFLTLYPLLIGVFAVAAATRVGWRPARLGLIGAVVVLFAASNFRTIDPVSRAAFGTWPFGTHDLIDVTATTGECCGHGRDQLVYNFEFVHVASLQDRALRAIRPTADTVLSMDHEANWLTIGRVDPITFSRTLRRSGTIEPRVLDTRALAMAASLPDQIFYFAYENVENESSLAWLRERYDVTGEFDFDERGYRLRVYRLTRREG